MTGSPEVFSPRQPEPKQFTWPRDMRVGDAAAEAAAAFGYQGGTPSSAGHPNHLVFYVCFYASLLAALRLARCIWVLHHVVTIATGQSKNRGPGE